MRSLTRPVGRIFRGALTRAVELPRAARRGIVVGADVILVAISVWAAYALRVGGWEMGFDLWCALTIACLAFWLPAAFFTGVYRSLIRFSGARTMANVVGTVTGYAIPVAVVFSVYGIAGVPRTFGIIQPLLLLILLAGSRLGARFILFELLWRQGGAQTVHRVMIYGAGRSGQQLAHSLRHEGHLTVLGYIDDDQRLDGQRLDGHPVFGSDRLEALLAEQGPDEVLLALPNVTRGRRRAIIETLQRHHVRVRSLPSISHIIDGRVTVDDLRPIQIEELLGRDPVAPNEVLMGRTIFGKTVLVSGAGGSIGSELCRQILACRPQRLILLELSEYALFAIERELALINTEQGYGVALVPELGNVAERTTVARVMKRHRPDTVFHAAAYKHVPLVEANPLAGMRNNIFGTLAMVTAAEAAGVANFILISTDKAVRPTNVMGASKRVCEQVLQARAAVPGQATVFSMVRFGNVLGSSGSVVPTFREQIAAGGPVTLTHRDITRYFMTIPEAAQLVVQASAMARGGDVFLLDMGEPVRIADLAEAMVRLSGLTVRDADRPDGDIEIVETGLRPGEKLYEELLIDETAQPTHHERIMTAAEAFLPWEALGPALDTLEHRIRDGDAMAALAMLRDLVPEYRAASAAPAVTA